jgi:hypothetical protein
MTPLLVSTAFMLAVFALCLVRPVAGRGFLSVFFLLMGLGVNLGFVLFAPEMFVELGTGDPVLPLYASFFANLVAAAPALWGFAVVAFEAAVGVLLLQRGVRARWGVAGAILFLVGITPLGPWTQANPILIVALTTLWFRGVETAPFASVRRPERGGAGRRPDAA